MATRQSGLFLGLSVNALLRAMGWVPTTELTEAESASTLFRFFRSQHVRDLKLIFAAALFVFLTHLSIVLLVGIGEAVHSFFVPPKEMDFPLGFFFPQEGPPPSFGNRLFTALSAFFSFTIKYIGPGIPIYGAIMGWAYLSASARLGVVDLFASEISTLCRVGTIFDIGKHYVDAYAAPEKHSGSSKFVSEEQYFPVFQSNSRDLQVLEATVVNYIAEFYSYMKAMRDAMRRVAETTPPTPGAPSVQTRDRKTEPDPWHAAVVNVIYLVYLAYESARKAAKELIEFQPAHAERSIVILLTELKCYSFLREHFDPSDIRCRRLQLRATDYKQEVPETYRKVMSPGLDEKDWLQARELIPELKMRYKEALGEDLV
jgi:hypothetical protein